MRGVLVGLCWIAVAIVAVEGRALPKQGFNQFENAGDRINLASVAKLGKDSAGVVGELWKLGAGAITGDGDDAGQAHTNQLRQEDAAALRHFRMARAAKLALQDESGALSYGIDQKIAGFPGGADCYCARSMGETVLAEARQQVLSEEGEPTNSTGDCPCNATVVGAVTEVLQEKLEQLTNELGSKAAASLAMKRALMSMRLPSYLASEVVKELDSEIQEADQEETSADGGGDSDGPLKVVVNNNMNGLADNSTEPYFYGYKNVPAYLKLGIPGQDSEETVTSGKGFKTVVVNVNNNIIMPRHWHWSDWNAGPACHPYCFHHSDSVISALHSKGPEGSREHAIKGVSVRDLATTDPHVKGGVTARSNSADQKAKVAQVQKKVQKLKILMAQQQKGNMEAKRQARGRSLEHRTIDADRANKLARKIHAVAKQLVRSEASSRTGSGQNAAHQTSSDTPQNPRWEAARQRLIDTAMALERVARNKAEAIREDMDVKARQARLQSSATV